MIPGVGFIVQILILIVGHAFNIGINVLGAFIHSMRLQYVEFFQKFFEGGGSLFKPFSLKAKYVKLKNN
jgi:V/A-type H+-transporting ATPase subunit I